MQVDFIDLQSCPDGEMKYILHLQDAALQVENSPVEYQIGVRAPSIGRTVVSHVQEQGEVLEAPVDDDAAANKCLNCAASGELCEICERQERIEERREIARNSQESQAAKMLERSNKRFKPAEEGDNVNVPIPEVDRGRLDPANFTAVVMDHNEETGLCTLGTTVGTLDTQFSRNQFELLPQKFVSTADVPENVTVGVREAARLHSNTGGQGFFKCSCQTKCETKKCKCRKDGVRCNSRCHKNRSCRNHDNDLI